MTMIPLPMVVDISGGNYFPVSTQHKAAAVKGLAMAKHVQHTDYTPGCVPCHTEHYAANQRHLRALGMDYDASAINETQEV